MSVYITRVTLGTNAKLYGRIVELKSDTTVLEKNH